MKYKLIALDIDFTLLRTDGTIAERTLSDIKKASDAGVLVVLATGRMKRGVRKLYEQLSLTSPIICGGGSLVFDKDYGVMAEDPIGPELVHELVALANSRNIVVHTFTSDEVCFQQESEFSKMYCGMFGFHGIVMPDMAERMDITSPKVLMISEEQKIADIIPVARGMFPMLNIVRSRSTFLEFTRNDVSKATALDHIGKLLGIDKSEMIAVGDNEIDLSMVKYAGLGCSVGNGTDELKKTADYISADCDHDGVGEIIEKFILD